MAKNVLTNHNTRSAMATSVASTFQTVIMSTIISFVFAQSTFSHPRLKGFVGAATKLCAFSCVIAPIFSIFNSKIPHVFTAPNMALGIFFRVVGQNLAEQLPQDDELIATFLVAIVIGSVIQGCSLLVIGRFGFSRVADYLPYPVLCGYLSMFGIMFFRAAYLMQKMEGASLKSSLVSGALTMIITAVFSRCQLKGRLILTAPILCFAAACFYATIFAMGDTIEEMRARRWLMSLTSFDTLGVNGVSHWYPHVVIALAPQKVQWIALYRASLFPLGSMMFLLCLKETLVIGAFERNSYKSTATANVLTGAELKTLGWANVIGSLCGGIGTTLFPALQTAQSTTASSVAAALIMGMTCFTSFAFFAYIPKFLFAGFLAAQGVPLMIAYLIKPWLRIQSRAEFLTIPIIIGIFLFWGIPQAIAIGAALSVLIFTFRFHSVGVIKYEASAVTRRSSIDRDPFMRDWLDEHGDCIWTIQLTGYLFFGNASKLLRRIQRLFTPDDRPETLGASIDRDDEFPQFLVLDFPLVSGIDAKSIEVLLYISKITRKHNCVLCLCGVNPDIRKQLDHAIEPERRWAFTTTDESRRLMRRDEKDWHDVTASLKKGRSKKGRSKKWEFKRDVDSALGDYEDEILHRLMTESSVQGERTESPTNSESAASAGEKGVRRKKLEVERRLRMLDIFPDPSCTGFIYCLKYLEKVHRIELKELLPLAELTVQKRIKQGTILMNVGKGTTINFNQTGGDGDGGLYFIEHGFITVQRDPNQSTDGRRRVNQHSISRSRNLVAAQSRNFRLTRLGPGQVIGALELTSGYRSMGVWEAATNCVLHYLPFTTLVQLEKENPVMLLRMHQLLGRIIADRTDKTQEHVTSIIDSIYSGNSGGQTRHLSMGMHRQLRRISMSTKVASPSGTLSR
jgi:SulP family sulfate permease